MNKHKQHLLLESVHGNWCKIVLLEAIARIYRRICCWNLFLESVAGICCLNLLLESVAGIYCWNLLIESIVESTAGIYCCNLLLESVARIYCRNLLLESVEIYLYSIKKTIYCIIFCNRICAKIIILYQFHAIYYTWFLIDCSANGVYSVDNDQ